MQEKVQAIFDKLAISVCQYEHKPLRTVADAHTVTSELGMPDAWVKNLFLKDRKKRPWLVVADDETTIALKVLGKQLDALDLRFADEHMLMECLGIIPGAVSPLALINDEQHVVQVVLDKALFNHAAVLVHPLTNDVTVAISPDDLERYIQACGNSFHVMDLHLLR